MKKEIFVTNKAGEFIDMVQRKLIQKQIGNFSPVFARYNKEVYLVQSMNCTDLSDAFRRNKKSFEKLFIVV